MGTTFYHISERAVERVAEVAASSVPGTLAVDAKLAGLAGRSFPRIDVHLDRQSGVAAIEAEIATAYPAPIAAITDAVRATVISHVRTLTGLDVSRVNVSVASIEAQELDGRVTWDEVASHSAFAIPTPIRVHQLSVESPRTKQRAPLKEIHSRSLADDMWEFNRPQPVSVASVKPPQPVKVRTEGFAPSAAQVRAVDTPAPASPWSPDTPEPRVPAPFSVTPTQLRRVRTPEPAAVRRVVAPLRRPLKEVSTGAAVQVTPVRTAPQRPLDKVNVKATPLRKVAAPAPTPLTTPQAPRPKPLKQISITPVVNDYDRTR